MTLTTHVNRPQKKRAKCAAKKFTCKIKFWPRIGRTLVCWVLTVTIAIVCCLDVVSVVCLLQGCSYGAIAIAFNASKLMGCMGFKARSHGVIFVNATAI